MPLCDETTARRIDDERRWNEDFPHDNFSVIQVSNNENLWRIQITKAKTSQSPYKTISENKN